MARRGVPHTATGRPIARETAANRQAVLRRDRGLARGTPRATLARLEPVSPSTHSRRYFAAVGALAVAIDGNQVDAMAEGLAALRERGGRLFIVGVGGGA